MDNKLERIQLEDEQVERIGGGLVIKSLGSKKVLFADDDPSTVYTFNNVVDVRLFILDNCNGAPDEQQIQMLLDANLIWPK